MATIIKTPPAPLTGKALEAQQKRDLEAFGKQVQTAYCELVETIAKSKDYGIPGIISGTASVLSYTGFENDWKVEAIKFGQWRATCHTKLYEMKADVLAGRRLPPVSVEAALAELPTLIW